MVRLPFTWGAFDRQDQVSTGRGDFEAERIRVHMGRNLGGQPQIKGLFNHWNSRGTPG
jgi:hypothetical protein